MPWLRYVDCKQVDRVLSSKLVPALSYSTSFVLCSTGEKARGTTMMRDLLICLAAVIAAPALGQEAAAEAPPPGTALPSLEAATPSASGFRITAAADFQLIEHGLWWPIARPLADGHAPGPASRSVAWPTKTHSMKKISPSQFRRAAYLPHVYAAEVRFGLPRGLLDAVIWTESRYNPLAISKAGAAGLGQLMPGTARDLGVANRFDPYSNIGGAARYLRQMLDKFGVVHLALAAYNAGPNAVGRRRSIPLNGETPGYVRNVLLRWNPS